MKKMLFVMLGALGFAAGSIIADPSFILKNKSPYYIDVFLEGSLKTGEKGEFPFTLEPKKEYMIDTPAIFDYITISWCNVDNVMKINSENMLKPADKSICTSSAGTKRWEFIRGVKAAEISKYYIKFSADGDEVMVEPQEGRFGRTTELKKNYSLRGNIRTIKEA